MRRKRKRMEEKNVTGVKSREEKDEEIKTGGKGEWGEKEGEEEEIRVKWLKEKEPLDGILKINK